MSYALVAQLDRVIGFEPIGRGFESLRARQFKKALHLIVGLFLCLLKIKWNNTLIDK